MKHVIAPVKNLRLLSQAGESLASRDAGVPGIGLICGDTGAGKTTAAAWYANHTNAVYVRALALWTPSAMLSAIMRELDAKPMLRCSEMMDFIITRLSLTGRPLFIDEADYLADKKRMLETLRDLHDLSTMPVILIGMRDFRRRVMHREQLAGRISQWVEFRPADISDARVLADTVCEVEVADDLLAELNQKTGGSMRGLVVGLSRIEAYARKNALKRVTASDWNGRAFVLSSAPPTRVTRAA